MNELNIEKLTSREKVLLGVGQYLYFYNQNGRVYYQSKIGDMVYTGYYFNGKKLKYINKY